MTRGLPSPVALRTIADALRSALFPAHFGEADLPGALADLEDQVRRTSHGEESRVVRAFAERLPRIRMLLSDDAQAAYEGDPAAVSIDEVLLCYPGFTAITYHRIAHEALRAGEATLGEVAIKALDHSGNPQDRSR